MRRLVVGISGASGVIYGIRLTELLKGRVETHLILTDRARQTIRLETDSSPEEIERRVDYAHDDHDLADVLASGSFHTDGMVVVPCSIKTLSAVANCYSETLLARAADVHLKERRTLILAVRETPLHLGHLKLMERAAEAGATILPPVPAFYHRPRTVEELVDQTLGKILDLLSVDHELFDRWGGGKAR